MRGTRGVGVQESVRRENILLGMTQPMMLCMPAQITHPQHRQPYFYPAQATTIQAPVQAHPTNVRAKPAQKMTYVYPYLAGTVAPQPNGTFQYTTVANMGASQPYAQQPAYQHQQTAYHTVPPQQCAQQKGTPVADALASLLLSSGRSASGQSARSEYTQIRWNDPLPGAREDAQENHGARQVAPQQTVPKTETLSPHDRLAKQECMSKIGSTLSGVGEIKSGDARKLLQGLYTLSDTILVESLIVSSGTTLKNSVANVLGNIARNVLNLGSADLPASAAHTEAFIVAVADEFKQRIPSSVISALSADNSPGSRAIIELTRKSTQPFGGSEVNDFAGVSVATYVEPVVTEALSRANPNSKLGSAMHLFQGVRDKVDNVKTHANTVTRILGQLQKKVEPEAVACHGIIDDHNMRNILTWKSENEGRVAYGVRGVLGLERQQEKLDRVFTALITCGSALVSSIQTVSRRTLNAGRENVVTADLSSYLAGAVLESSSRELKRHGSNATLTLVRNAVPALASVYDATGGDDGLTPVKEYGWIRRMRAALMTAQDNLTDHDILKFHAMSGTELADSIRDNKAAADLLESSFKTNCLRYYTFDDKGERKFTTATFKKNDTQ